MLASAMAFTFTACDDDDDDDDGILEDDQTEIDVFDQDVSRNMIYVQSVEVPAGGWVVVHRDAGGQPEVPDIISEPFYVSEGETEDIELLITSPNDLSGGETLWVMLHEDDGDQQYEFDGSQDSPDQPYMDDGAIVMDNISIGGPFLDVSTAVYDSAANEVYVPEVNAAVDGWLVVHNEAAAGGPVLPGIIGKVEVSEGVNEDVTIPLDNSAMVNDGQMLFPMLHIDNGEIGEYEFDGSADSNDPPEIFGYDSNGDPKIIVKGFQVQF